MNLTQAQLQAIDYHLRYDNLLTNEELILELTDHYSASLDELLSTGLAFGTALATITAGFGGCNELQKMERQYNRITFRHYDQRWLGFIRESFRWPLSIGPISLFVLAFWTTLEAPKPHSFSLQTLIDTFWGSVGIGTLIGMILGLPLFSFFGSILKHGVHNVPTEISYILSRFLPALLLLYLFAGCLIYLAPHLPAYIYEGSLATCVMLAAVLLYSHRKMYDSLYELTPSR
ncbi:hypothetical protein DYU11_02880 [Fibrisoma montanum]|uniref:Uncharacterized protein n=1 Tax=Fibrisoma montanum TaxID=2305895 RepID=A0A418MIT8_9BACT|nr:hypothetical protein [Fibrisoma montanum]RIV27273.1 hypothetical protein DYU11_02880 [Fibrisoma montanum]